MHQPCEAEPIRETEDELDLQDAYNAIVGMVNCLHEQGASLDDLSAALWLARNQVNAAMDDPAAPDTLQ